MGAESTAVVVVAMAVVAAAVMVAHGAQEVGAVTTAGAGRNDRGGGGYAQATAAVGGGTLVKVVALTEAWRKMEVGDKRCTLDASSCTRATPPPCQHALLLPLLFASAFLSDKPLETYILLHGIWARPG